MNEKEWNALARVLQPELERAGWNHTVGFIVAVLDALYVQFRATRPPNAGTETLLRMANERGDFIRMEDGYTAYAPTDASRGALSSWMLRALADEMDRRDATWHAIVSGDPTISHGCLQVWKWDDAPEEWKRLHSNGDEDWLALIPNVLLASSGNEPELWWMRWYPELNDAGRVHRFKEEQGAPCGFEIWIGVHA